MPDEQEVSYQRIRDALEGSPSSFPEISSIAEMRPHSHTIHLHNMSQRAFRDDVENGRISLLRPTFETIYHEVTHWVDLLGTVWGQGYLTKLYDAYHCGRGSNEDQFWKSIELYDEDRRIMLPRYYHLVLDEPVPHSVERPWRLTNSCGIEFSPDGQPNNSRPIFFTKFSDHDSDELIARQPLTVGTLLETCATWSELQTGMEIFMAVDESERTVGLPIWSREKTQILYTKEYTIYTAPTHLLSLQIGTGEAIRSFEFSAALANIVLNFTERHFRMLAHPETFGPFGDARLQAFVAAQDYGYAFAAIAFNAPRVTDDQNSNDWLDRALLASNLPVAKDILNEANAYLEALPGTLEVRSTMDETRNYLMGVGRHFFRHRMNRGNCAITSTINNETALPLPQVFDANCELMSIGSVSLDPNRYDPIVMFDAEWQLRDFTSNFLIGCRGI